MAAEAPDSKQGLPIVPFSSQAEWEQWLAHNGATSKGLWLKIAKKGSGADSVSSPRRSRAPSATAGSTVRARRHAQRGGEALPLIDRRLLDQLIFGDRLVAALADDGLAIAERRIGSHDRTSDGTALSRDVVKRLRRSY